MYQISVCTGDSMDFNALAFGQKHPGTLRFLENQMSNVENVMSNFTAQGMEFMARAKDIYQSFNSADALRLAKAAANKFTQVFQRDEIKSIYTLEDMQSACLTMQRWIMAEPTIRDMFHRQRLDGYSGTYVDMHPSEIGSTHYDYQRVTSGMIIVDEETGDWSSTTHFDPQHPDDHVLDIVDKVDIISTWDMVKMYLDRNEEDPTDPFCGRL